jgi:hypothetical protein
MMPENANARRQPGESQMTRRNLAMAHDTRTRLASKAKPCRIAIFDTEIA